MASISLLVLRLSCGLLPLAPSPMRSSSEAPAFVGWLLATGSAAAFAALGAAGSLAIASPACLALKISGNLIGPIALVLANLAGLGALILLQALPERPGPAKAIDLEGEHV